MLPPVQKTLEDASGVTSRTADRIYQGLQPEGQNPTQQDFIVWQLISNVADLNLSELPEVDDQLIQVDCYSKSQAAARLLAIAARDALEVQTHVVRGPVWTYEEETKLHRYSMDAEYWNSRSGGGEVTVPINIPFGGVKSADFNVAATSTGYTFNVIDPATANALLPPAASCAGAIFLFDRGVSDGVITISTTGGDTIEGDAGPFTLNSNAIFYSNGVSNFIRI